MKTFKKSIIFIMIISILTSCDKDENNVKPILKDKITGYAQKGPFNNGTTVIISELNSDFSQSGKTIISQIENNEGLYEISNIEFATQYVEINASGFYFDEVSGENSIAQLTLNALSDLSDKSTLNINVLTHLEKERVEYLISKEKSFNDAKTQALQEILTVFNINLQNIKYSELLNISKEGDENAILLAISAIIQGNRLTADLSLLLANFRNDIKTDGKLDNPSLKNSIISYAKVLNLSEIRSNLESYYDNLGIDYIIPNFEKYVQFFIDNTDFESSNLITYPENGLYGENILFFEKDTISSEEDYSLAAKLPQGADLKIKVDYGHNYLGIVGSSSINWHTKFNEEPEERSVVFTSIESGKDCDIEITFSFDTVTFNNEIVIEYYEFNSELPNWTRILTNINYK